MAETEERKRGPRFTPKRERAKLSPAMERQLAVEAQHKRPPATQLRFNKSGEVTMTLGVFQDLPEKNIDRMLEAGVARQKRAAKEREQRQRLGVKG